MDSKSSASDISAGLLQRKILRERVLLEFLHKSSNEWKTILEDICRPYHDITKVDSEFKLRYLNQQLSNAALKQHIIELSSDVKKLSKGRRYLEKQSDPTVKQPPDYRILHRQLEFEKCSLNSMIELYERQRDREFTLYHRAKESATSTMKELRIQQRSLIKQQEDFETGMLERLTVLNPASRRTTLRAGRKPSLSWKTIVMKNKALTMGNCPETSPREGYSRMYFKKQQQQSQQSDQQ